ncbi:MAG: ribosome biogenesis GTP-binding protein YihA/YsxC [Deltaproteobacteria bacterium]|nr:ribosome biogenesis GTP-binding protein YihA/YsxC [Deltaproteobacteria bacterium]
MDVLEASFVMEARSAEGLPPTTGGGPHPVLEIAFAGRSNVGKSSLLNAIAQRKGLARTSGTPGCTRGLVLFDLMLRSGTSLRIVDLPGYGYAARNREERTSWGPMIESYLQKRECLSAVVILVDARRGPEDEERQLIEFLSTLGVSMILAVTKIDKLAKNERFGVLNSLRKAFGAKVIGVSGHTGEGRDELVSALVKIA